MPLFVINDNIFVNYAHKHMCYLAHPDYEINQYIMLIDTLTYCKLLEIKTGLLMYKEKTFLKTDKLSVIPVIYKI